MPFLEFKFMEEAETKFSDHRVRVHQAEWDRSYGGGVCIAALEMAQHVINSDVFQEGLGILFKGQKRCHVRFS
ncbi:hypothetical protein MNBD_GAMMA24-2764 [hydrothermal vent metagenome]|uniref:Uncharacterized protein n=1 Tax=hydrothermal vent metagenome TaxID=652676 RepID=A0A3B1C7U0_9ZZZZ